MFFQRQPYIVKEINGSRCDQYILSNIIYSIFRYVCCLWRWSSSLSILSWSPSIQQINLWTDEEINKQTKAKCLYRECLCFRSYFFCCFSLFLLLFLYLMDKTFHRAMNVPVLATATTVSLRFKISLCVSQNFFPRTHAMCICVARRNGKTVFFLCSKLFTSHF